MITCIIVDDQKEAIGVIQDHLKKFSEIKPINCFTDSLEALSFLEKNQKIDLVFLDIEMPNLNGLDFIESLRQKYGKQIPKFIFTTGYHKYALSGYEKGVVDFLVKPIGFTRFKMSIDRIIDNWKDPVAGKMGSKEQFYIEVDGIKIKMNYENIMYVESDRNCVHIFDRKGKKTVYQTMQSIEELLSNDDRFVRVHKSYIVSESFVDSIKGNDIVMDLRNGTIKTIPIGRTYKEAALKKLLNFQS